MSEQALDICVVAHLAYGAMVGGDSGHIGGVERQTTLMARWLASRGHRVSLITWDEGQEDGILLDGVRVLKVCRREAGVPGFRFFHPRWTALNGALRRAGARLYYQNSAEYVTGQVALWAKRRGRRFVFSVAGDRDVRPDLPVLQNLRERVFYRYGLRRADRLIAQTRTQQRMLRDAFDLDADVLPMPCIGPAPGEYAPPPAPGPEAGVLWLGRLTGVKRPDLFLDLAEACPDLRFDLVGPTSGEAYSRRTVERARGLANVAYHGPAPRDQVARFYRRAACLCCTSDHEGFPNTFLEAWSHGLPVVSRIDPDGLIAEQDLGRTAADVTGLGAAIRALLATPEAWRRASTAARSYYLENHLPEPAMARFERVFREVSTGEAIL
jgi:glycosyltransferase involved in cell wall biosynthesis